MSKPHAVDDHNHVTVERALTPNGGEVYTIALGSTHASVITGAAALANMAPTTWVLRAIGERIAYEVAGIRQQPAPESAN